MTISITMLVQRSKKFSHLISPSLVSVITSSGSCISTMNKQTAVILRAFVNFKLINEAVIIHTVVSRPVNSITFVLKQTRSFCYHETLAGVDHVCVSRDSRKPILRVFNSLLEIRFQTFQTLISYYSRYYWLILRRIVFCCTAR